MADETPPLPPSPYSPGAAPANPGGIAPGLPPASIPLTPAPRTQARKPELAKGAEEPKDSVREVIETVVFVVVLVLLLKTFLAEAFVIPTGSMATTLLGYHRTVTCEQCGYSFPVNASNEGDPQTPDGKPRYISNCTCPNCGAVNSVPHPPQ